MKQNKISCGSQEYHDYSWLTMKPAIEEPEYQTAENYAPDLDLDSQVKVLTLQLKDIRNQLKGVNRALKMHIQNYPFKELQANKVQMK